MNSSCTLVPAMTVSDNDKESYLYYIGTKMGVCIENSARVCVYCEGFSCVVFLYLCKIILCVCVFGCNASV